MKKLIGLFVVSLFVVSGIASASVGSAAVSQVKKTDAQIRKALCSAGLGHNGPIQCATNRVSANIAKQAKFEEADDQAVGLLNK